MMGAKEKAHGRRNSHGHCLGNVKRYKHSKEDRREDCCEAYFNAVELFIPHKSRDSNLCNAPEHVLRSVLESRLVCTRVYFAERCQSSLAVTGIFPSYISGQET
ncbi:unnamed protein product [Cercospora beticola]|nr:unnamed protein product [Cercospora beticola]